MKLASISILLSAPLGAKAFSNPILTLINKANPSINEYAQAQESALINIRLDIGSDSEPSSGRFGINGLMLELQGDKVADYPHPNLPGVFDNASMDENVLLNLYLICDCWSLPGANGPNPQLSSGPKTLSVLREGNHIDIMGSKSIPFDNGAWEMIWRKNASAGALIMGFDAGEIRRNQVTLPMGRVYVTFPVWTSESLQELRDRKALAEEKAMEAFDRQKEEVAKMQQTGNLLAKAMHFRNACKAAEDIDYSGYRSYQGMNLDMNTVPLDGDLHLCSLGTVWTKKDGMFGADEQVLLGTASVAAGKKEDLEEKKAVSERELKSVAFDGLRP
jgi:hypothetical protein